MKFMEPQSRLIIDKVFKRRFDGFTDEAKAKINWIMLAGDAVGLYILFSLI